MDENKDWVEDRLAKLNPDDEWQPQAAAARERLEERRTQRKFRGRWPWILSAAAAGAVCLLALPQPRAFAAHAVEPLVEQSEDAFNPAELHAHLFRMMWAVHEWLGLVPPNIALTDSTGASFRLSDYHSKMVLLHVWPAQCRACQDEVRWLAEVPRTNGEQEIAVIGIAVDDKGWKDVRPMIEAMKINYRVALADDAAVKSYGGVETLPQTFLLNGKGLIVVKHTGIMNRDQFDREILRKLGSGRSEFDGPRPEGH